MSQQATNPLIRHKLKWYSAPYLIITGAGVLTSLFLALLVASSLSSGLAIPPLLLAGLGAAVAIAVILLALRRRFIWIMDDRVFKGIQFGTSRVRALGSISFANVEEFSFLTESDRAKSIGGHRFYFCSKAGWSRDLSFQIKDGQDAATAVAFFLQHVDRSAWEPELEDWIYDWLRSQGKHLSRLE